MERELESNGNGQPSEAENFLPDTTILNALEGDPKAWEAVVAYFDPRLDSYFHYRTGSRETTEDLMQITLMKAFEAREDFDPAAGDGDLTSNFRAWVFRIAQNSLVDNYRRHSRTFIPLSALSPLPGKPRRSRDIDLAFPLAKRLREMLSGQQLSVALLRLEGLSYRKISHHLGTSNNAARAAMRRAREAIERELIYPAGWTRVPKPQDGEKHKPQAFLGATLFLGVWYAPEESIRRGLQTAKFRNREIDGVQSVQRLQDGDRPTEDEALSNVTIEETFRPGK